MKLPLSAFMLSTVTALEVRQSGTGSVVVVWWEQPIGTGADSWIAVHTSQPQPAQFARRIGRKLFREAEVAAAWKRAALIVTRRRNAVGRRRPVTRSSR